MAGAAPANGLIVASRANGQGSGEQREGFDNMRNPPWVSRFPGQGLQPLHPD